MNNVIGKMNLILKFLIIIAVFAACYYLSIHSYLLFHSLAEIFSITIAFALFLIAWNSREFNTNRYVLFLGVAFLFIGGIDLIHTLAYKGMNIFVSFDANLPTQLWISSRYLQAITFIIAPFFIKARLKPKLLMLIYAAVFLVLLITPLLRLFPNCYIEGFGLTQFKIISEYITSLILLISLFLLYRKREFFDKQVIWLLYIAIVATILSGIAFTFYVSVYGISNFIGHIFKLIAYVFIYQAVIVTSLKKPYNILFNNLQLSETRYKTAQKIAHVGNWEYNVQTTKFWTSDEGKRIYGFDPESLNFTTDEVENCIPEREKVHQALIDLIESEKKYDLEFEIITKNNSESKFIHSKAELERDSSGKPLKISGVIADITKRKRAEDDRERLLAEKEILLHEVHHRIKNNMATIESLLKLHSRRISNHDAQAALQDAGGRVKSMGLLYDKLFRSDNFNQVSMQGYLSPLVDEIIGVFPNKETVEIEKYIEDFGIDAKLVFPLGIIINELITNIMKYAFKEINDKKIIVTAVKKEDKAVIIVQDNGVGMDELVDLKSASGFGLQLIDMLISQLKGTIKFERKDGMKFIIEFDI